MKKMVGGGKVLFLVPVLVLGSTSVITLIDPNQF